MTSVRTYFLCGCPHEAVPSPIQVCPHEPDPICVDVINGWPLNQDSLELIATSLLSQRHQSLYQQHSQLENNKP